MLALGAESTPLTFHTEIVAASEHHLHAYYNLCYVNDHLVKTERIITGRRTVKELVEFIEEAVREGLAKEEISSQVDLLLDRSSRRRFDKSLKEARKGNMRHLKDPQTLLKSLHGIP